MTFERDIEEVFRAPLIAKEEAFGAKFHLFSNNIFYVVCRAMKRWTDELLNLAIPSWGNTEPGHSGIFITSDHLLISKKAYANGQQIQMVTN